MIRLKRKKNHRLIFQKNVNSDLIIKGYLDAVNSFNSEINYEALEQQLKNENIYKGRDVNGSISTMGVRMSQMCFYMFGYKNNKYFIPSPMTENLIKENDALSKQKNALINVFSIQFPHPYSQKTPKDFKIHFGRLLIKMLLDDRIGKKIYIDEFVWFLPFLNTIDQKRYDDLINSIIEYRSYTYSKKLKLFKSIPEYKQFMATVLHEFKYYFLEMFSKFDVFELVQDKEHNEGKLICFAHPGESGSCRYDNIPKKGSTERYSGYFKLNDLIIDDAKKLTNAFSAFEIPMAMASSDIFTKQDWLTALYESEPLKYLSIISNDMSRDKQISDIVNEMVHSSKYGSNDGKEFENSLKPFMELFRETVEVEIHSGSNDTDLLCIMCDEKNNNYKFNVEAKKRKKAVNELNGRTLEKHINSNESRFCLVIAPRFASGVESLISGYRVATIRADDFGTYCYKECKYSDDGMADFESIYKIIKKRLGTDITNEVRRLTEKRYGITVK